MIRVGIAEDQALVRESLAIVLGLEPDMEVMWTAATGVQAVENTAQTPVDVILVDLRLPIMDGVTAIRRIKATNPSITMIVLTTFHQDEWILDALQAGAAACFLKEIPPNLLTKAIRLIQNKQWVPSEWATEWRLYAPDIQFQSRIGGTFADEAPDTLLTSRDIELLRRICSGDTNSEIAAKMHLSEGTVKNYVSLLYAKLGVRHRAEAIRIAHERGFCS